MPAPDQRPPVLVTRPAAEAALWVADLQARGIPAEALPLIDIAPVPDLSAARACWASLNRYAALMFVSGNAVAQFFAARPASLLDALPAELRFMAPGPGTAQRLLAAGVPASQIDTPPADAAQFDSQTLWQQVGHRAWAGRQVLIVRGQSAGQAGDALAAEAAAPGRDWLARRLTDSGATVEFLCAYQRQPPQLDAASTDRIQRSQHDGSVWLFSSSEALGYLQQNLRELDLGSGEGGADWAEARAIATHPRIAQAAREAGWGVVIESRPALADIVASIESLLS